MKMEVSEKETETEEKGMQEHTVCMYKNIKLYHTNTTIIIH
jgi:hypothetical protein